MDSDIINMEESIRTMKNMFNTKCGTIIKTSLGLFQSRASQSGVRLVSGDQSEAFILIFGDSNCIDGAHLIKPCYWLVYAMLNYTSAGYLPQVRNIIIIISSCFLLRMASQCAIIF